MTFVPHERVETVGLGRSAAQPPIGSWLQQTTLQLKVSHEEHPERGGAGHHQHCPPVLSSPSGPSALRRDPCPLIRNLAGSRATGLCSWQTSSPAPGVQLPAMAGLRVASSTPAFPLCSFFHHLCNEFSARNSLSHAVCSVFQTNTD